MYRVMIVDDEYYVRKSIQNRVHWDGLACTIVAEAENGGQAFDLIGQIKPDIVLVDIMMPEMDGLELIRRARETSPETQFAILSGYDDFLYTREAIKLQVTDYIKKPVDIEELEATVRAMIRTIEANRQTKQRMEDLVGQVQDLSGMKIERALNDACGSPEGYRALESLLQDGPYAWVLLFLAPVLPHSGAGSDQGELNSLKEELVVFLRGAMAGAVYAAVSDADAHEIRVLVPGPSLHAVQKAADELGQYLKSHPAASRGRRVSLAYSQTTSLPGLYEQYGYTLRLLKSKIFTGQAGGLKPPALDETTAVFALLENVKRCLAARQFKRLGPILNQLFSEKTVTSVQLLEDILFHLYGLAREYAGRCKEQLPEEHDLKLTGSHSLLYYDSLAELMEQTRDLLLMVFCEGSPIDDDEITLQVKKYIEEHYAENITLKSVADLFYLNASYLSSLFKGKTGGNFNKYLTTIRINHARTLLTSLDMPVNDIAAVTGYNDPNYFSKAFKKRTGKTPSEYREGLKKQST